MSQYTENYHLEKPESNDNFENFRENYNSNMDIIDQHLGGGGGGGSDVSWNQLQVTGDKIATIRISGINTDVYSPNSQTFSMAISRANINSDEKYSTIFGKIKKWFADLKTVAFTANASDLTNDAGFITNTVNNLANYYLKSETYTQAEVNALIGAITTIHFEVVQTLPTSDIQTNVIYLVPKSTAGTNDVYDEYINTTGTSAGWELIGSTQVDLSNYYTKTQTDTLLDGKVSDVKVNDTSVVDSSHVANITSYEEVTIAQYNALPASKKNCGIAYFIKDLDNASVEGYPPLIYSLEEREVGVWTDGKPLYQKTFNLSTTFTITSTPQQLITITDIPFDTVLIVNANVYDSDDNRRYDIPNLTQATPDRIFAHMYLNKALNPCTFFVNVYSGKTNYAHCTDLNVTIQYTKTTDTAGSGIWNGQGGLAHHYSTNETVIGTWIDGKPVYEISFTLPSTITINNVSWTSSGVSIPNIKNVVDGELNRNGTQKFACSFRATNSVIEIQTYFNGAQCDTNSVVTLQYTKTTD